MESQKYLGEQFPDTPVLVRDTSLHKVLLNTEGLKRIGVIPEAERTVPPPGGVDVRRVDGMMTEELMEAGPGDAWLKLPVWPLPRIKKSTIYGINSCHKFGIALIQEASATPFIYTVSASWRKRTSLSLTSIPTLCAGTNFSHVRVWKV
jgi:predicted amidohydrolase YtcJ